MNLFKKLKKLSFLLLISFSNCFAMEEQKDDRPFLFTCSKDSQSFLLLGTQHNIPYSLLPESVQQKCENADLLVVEEYSEEKDIDEARQKTSDILRDNFRYPTSWKEEFLKTCQIKSDSQIVQTIESLCEGRDALYYFHPVIIPDMMHYLFHFQREDTSFGMDNTLCDYHQSHHHQLLGLETDMDRINTVFIPLTEKWKGGLSLLRYAFSLNQYFQKIKCEANVIDAEKKCIISRQQLNSLSESEENVLSMDSDWKDYCYGDFGKFTSNESTLQRNELWLPRLIKILTDYPKKSILLTVGVAHLVGEKGLISLLEKEGFTVERHILEVGETPLWEKYYTLKSQERW